MKAPHDSRMPVPRRSVFLDILVAKAGDHGPNQRLLQATGHFWMGEHIGRFCGQQSYRPMQPSQLRHRARSRGDDRMLAWRRDLAFSSRGSNRLHSSGRQKQGTMIGRPVGSLKEGLVHRNLCDAVLISLRSRLVNAGVGLYLKRDEKPWRKKARCETRDTWLIFLSPQQAQGIKANAREARGKRAGRGKGSTPRQALESLPHIPPVR